MLAKNTLHLQYSPAFKAVEAFNEDMKRRGPWKLKAFWKYLCFLLLVMKKKETQFPAKLLCISAYSVGL